VEGDRRKNESVWRVNGNVLSVQNNGGTFWTTNEAEREEVRVQGRIAGHAPSPIKKAEIHRLR